VLLHCLVKLLKLPDAVRLSTNKNRPTTDFNGILQVRTHRISHQMCGRLIAKASILLTIRSGEHCTVD